MKCRLILLLFFFIPFFYSAKASEISDTVVCDTISVPDTAFVGFLSGSAEFPRLEADSVKAKYKVKKRIAALLAFPFPFGILGLHRVFLGTKPYIPFVYIGTIGGCFLVLPIIDFIAILSADQETFKKFENNPRVFMWSH